MRLAATITNQVFAPLIQISIATIKMGAPLITESQGYTDNEQGDSVGQD
jgi:hypothetical protein